MKYYTSTTEFNCGIDLHARQMYVCVMDRQGKKLVHTNVKNNDFEFFLKLVQPYRHDLTVCCECMFGWYWLADACQAANLTFVLAHALYLKAIHGGKNKNDRIVPMSIPLRNGPCALFCGSASSTSGPAPHCSRAFTPINWPTTESRPVRLAATVIPGKSSSSRPKLTRSGRSRSKAIWP